LTAEAPAERPIVRAARPEDVKRLAELYIAAEEELGAMRGGRVLLGLGGRGGRLQQSLAKDLDDAECCMVVAVLGPDRPNEADQPRDIVGYGTCRALQMTGGELVGSIEDLYVQPAARRCGAGRVMAEFLVDWSQARGCVGVDANALPGNRAVKSFFEAEGFTARLLVMYRPLS
jgi:ribosomal protein S18 acetylase RimI-like enzyme